MTYNLGMSIYTKKGDKKETSIFSKKGGKAMRLSKADPLIEAIGAIDEANSYLGIIVSKLKTQKSKVKTKTQKLKLEEIQRNLFTIGAVLAGANVEIKKGSTKELEKEIDRMGKELPKLTKFILPGGSVISAHLMYARALVRKAERRVVFLTQKSKLKSQNSILEYMNRLSDYLFVQARRVNYKNKIEEVKWKIVK
jgi:cob(I)alamin adenosyltransferase